jgi:hypothetical protein
MCPNARSKRQRYLTENIIHFLLASTAGAFCNKNWGGKSKRESSDIINPYSRALPSAGKLVCRLHFHSIRIIDRTTRVCSILEEGSTADAKVYTRAHTPIGKCLLLLSTRRGYAAATATTPWRDLQGWRRAEREKTAPLRS